jgi:hypothetical protein
MEWKMSLSVTQAPVATAQPQEPVQEQKVALELAIYQRYTRKDVLYTAKTDDGRPRHYLFTIPQARILLAEVDDVDQRPIWRRARKVVTEVERFVDRSQAVVTDGSRVNVQPIEQDDTARLGLDNSRRLEDGTDDELAELLGPQGMAELGGETVSI